MELICTVILHECLFTVADSDAAVGAGAEPPGGDPVTRDGDPVGDDVVRHSGAAPAEVKVTQRDLQRGDRRTKRGNHRSTGCQGQSCHTQGHLIRHSVK